MSRLFKKELLRAIKGRGMIISISIGLIISISHIFQHVLPVAKLIDLRLENNAIMYCPPTTFAGWLGNAGYTKQGFWYFMLLPLLATIPFGDTFFMDKKNGYLKEIISPNEKKEYIVSKYIATIISGGLAITIPLLANLVITAMFLPSFPPQVTQGFAIGTINLWSEIFYTQPYIYILLYLIIDFVFAGLMATIALSVSLVAEYRSMVLLMPFTIQVFLYFLFGNLGLWKYEPLYFLQPGYGISDVNIVSIEIIIIIIATGYTFLCAGSKEKI